MWLPMLLLAVMACRSPVIEGMIFPIPPYLQQLRITDNCLTGLSWEYLIQKNITSHLRILNMENNCISSLNWMDSRHVPQLTWLSLAHNNLDYISPNNFKYLDLLEYLDLSDNVLYTLEGIFDSLRSLQRLNVAGNKLEHVQVNWFKNLSKLAELDISRNKMTFIPADTLQPLVSLSVFKLAENPLIQRDLSLLLGTGRRLETVDASRIGLIRVPSALTRSVRTLKLAGNQLTSINSGDLDSYPLLKLLDLSNNRLMIIEEDALGRLDGLEELILSGNILPTIPKSLPSRLIIFDLRQNAISILKSNDLQGLYLLKELNLSGNVISVIEGGSFHQLPALKKLDISDNPIKKLPSDTLSGPTNLVTLRMSGLISLQTEENQNQDTGFPILTPERLVTLDVSRSPALAAQLLADNAALWACKSLQELDLSYTNISAMRSNLAYVMPQLRKLNLIGNKWNCSMDQFWIGDWIRQHNSSMNFTTRCSTPIDLDGKLLQELPSLLRSKTTTMKTTAVQINTTTAKTNEIEKSTARHEIVNKTEIKEMEKSNNVSESLTISKTIVSKTFATTENAAVKSDIEKVISTISTSKPITTTNSSLNTQDLHKENITEGHKLWISPSVSEKTKKTITVTNEKKWPNPSTISDPQEYISKVVSYELPKFFTESTTAIDFEKNKQDKESVSTTSNIEYVFSTTNDDTKVTKETISTVPTTPDIEITITNAPSTESTFNMDVVSTTKVSFIKPKQAALIKTEESILNKYKNLKEEVDIHNKKSTNRVMSELPRSKLLHANEESRVNDEPKSFAEELNSQATESGARTSESLASGAHPGMLVLLGAAIGAAAALTVVLSRRATVKRRDRLYQRQENIEVHALTPTTELW